MFQIKSAALTHPGRKRSSNQDSVASFEPQDPLEIQASGNLYIVADGVGGAVKGEKASQYAAEKVRYEYYQFPDMHPGKRLEGTMRQVCREIYNHAQERESGRMATTMVAAVIHNNLLTVANVGDSRAYLIRNGKIKQITIDHSLVGEMVRDGSMTEEEAFRSKMKNRITRSLGGDPDTHVDIFPDIPLQPGDKILLCSDGLTRYARPADLTAMSAQGAPDEVAGRMTDFANQSGGADNISTIFITVGEEAETLVIKAEPETGPTSRQVEPKEKMSSKQLWWLYGLGGAAILILIALGITIFFTVESINFPNGKLQITFMPTKTPFYAGIIASPGPPTGTPSPPASPIPESPAELPSTPTPTERPLTNTPGTQAPVSSQITETATVTVTNTSIPDALKVTCVKKVVSTLSNTIGIFSYPEPSTYDSETQYEKYINCTGDNEGFAYCEDLPVVIEDHSIVQSTDWIIVSKDIDSQKCNIKKGHVLKENNQE